MKVVTVVVVMQVSNGVRMWCVIASIVSVLIAVSMCADMASADAIQVIYIGTEVLEQGEPPFNVYYIDCQPTENNDNTHVDIEISYGDGTVEIRTGEYCDTKMYVNGTIHNGVIVHDDGTHAVDVIAVISSPVTPDVIPTETLPPPTPAATATIQPTPQIVATSMPTQAVKPGEPTEEAEATNSIYLPVVMR